MEPVLLNAITPCSFLQDYVHKYQVFRFIFDPNITPPLKYHSPRPEHSITFYIKEPQKFSHINSDIIINYPRCVINGIYTVPIYRHGNNDFLAIKIVLQPTTLYRLKIIPVKDLINNFINAEEVFNNEVSVLCDQLSGTDEINHLIKLIENFLIKLIQRKCKPLQPIDKTSNYILYQDNSTSTKWLASQSCLSNRQFIRNFEERIGVSPKLFQKIIRFDRAFRLKNNHPHLDWLYIAIACGYYDYQHLVKDFKEFTYLTPPAFYEVEKASPERFFKLHEG